MAPGRWFEFKWDVVGIGESIGIERDQNAKGMLSDNPV
jgi:hypothetical protein